MKKSDMVRMVIEVLIGLIIVAYGFVLKDLYAKINDGVFVRQSSFVEQIVRRDRELDMTYKALCERLSRLEHNTDQILRYLGEQK